MDAQELHDLELKGARPTKGSRKRLEALLQAKEKSSSQVSRSSTHDPIGALAKALGVTPEELAKDAEEMGF